MSGRIDRRSLLRGGVVLGGTGAVAALASASGCAQAQTRTETLRLDVACRGDTFRVIVPPGNERDDYRGTTFSVEGSIYPADTIPVPVPKST